MKNSADFNVSPDTLNKMRSIRLMRSDLIDVFSKPLATFRNIEGLYISHTRTEYITVYAKFTESENSRDVLGAYGRYCRLDCDIEDYVPMSVTGEDSVWECVSCQAKMKHVKNIGATYGKMRLPPIYGFACPCCGQVLLEESLVLGDLASAEKMLNGK